MNKIIIALLVFAGRHGLVLGLYVGCATDEETPPPLPTCSELGCENTFCSGQNDVPCFCDVDGPMGPEEPMECVVEESSP